MDLFLLRHGCAEPSAARDRDRKLTVEGRQELQRVCAGAGESLRALTQVLVSPYVRAQQSFEEITSCVPELAATPRHIADFLTPGSNPQRVLDWLEQQPADVRVLLVTHQPLVGTLLDDLCGFETGRYRMGTAALAALRLPQVGRGLAELLWLKHP